MDSAQVLDELRRSQALLEGHFLLSSGNHSDRYFQCALALSDPRAAERLARALAARLPAGLAPRAVVGPALGAVVWAHEVARALGVRALFTEREGGAMALRRGFQLEPGERVLVVEDVLTTGGSAGEVLELVRARGAVAVGVGAIVNRSGGNPFAARGLPCFALADVRAELWPPADCPLCKQGSAPVKPGSRTKPAAV
jgi:orotate phosphoribosyltransferase